MTFRIFASPKPMLLGAALAAVVAVPGAVIAESSMLSELAGNWVGKGKALKRPDAKPEPIKCKITAILEADGTRLNQDGRCATTDQTSTIEGVIRFDPASGQYTGTWKTRADGRQSDLNGNRSGDTLVLTAAERGGNGTGTIELTPQSGGYVMRMSAQSSPGQPMESAEIQFSRR